MFTQITGLETNVNFLLQLARHPAFRAADVHTDFIPQHMDSLFPALSVTERQLCQAAVAVLQHERAATETTHQTTTTVTMRDSNPFLCERNFRINTRAIRTLRLRCHGAEHTIAIRQTHVDQPDHLQIRIGVAPDAPWQNVHVSRDRSARSDRLTIQTNIDGHLSAFSAVIGGGGEDGDAISIFDESGKTELQFAQPTYVELLRGDGASSAAASSQVVSPMPGVVDKVLVQPGDRVKAGDAVAVIIAMKMEHVLKAPRDGVVASVFGAAGGNVAKGAAVVTFEEVPNKEEATPERAQARA